MLEKINIIFNLSKNKKEQMGKIARQHIQEKFSKQIMLKNYFKFYQKIIS